MFDRKWCVDEEDEDGEEEAEWLTTLWKRFGS